MHFQGQGHQLDQGPKGRITETIMDRNNSDGSCSTNLGHTQVEIPVKGLLPLIVDVVNDLEVAVPAVLQQCGDEELVLTAFFFRRLDEAVQVALALANEDQVSDFLVFGNDGVAWPDELAEKLVDLQYHFQLWRFGHLKTVERVIGFKRGTGGTSGVAYLRKMLEVELFPELWHVRGAFCIRMLLAH